MKQLFFAFLIGLSWFWFSRYRMRNSVTVACTSMKEVGTYLHKYIAVYPLNRTLCVFDLDNTLLTIDSPLVWYRCKYRSAYKKLRRRYPDVTTAMLYRALAPYVRLTDPDVLPLLQSLQTNAIGFTASGTGMYADQTTMERYRYEELKAKGITFEKTFSDHKQLTLKECKPYKGQYPKYFNGILFSLPKLKGKTSKGTVLCAFLKKICFHPECIILIDDRVINHHTVRKELKRHFPNTKFIGILYTGAQTKYSNSLTEDEFLKGAEVLLKSAKAMHSIPTP